MNESDPRHKKDDLKKYPITGVVDGWIFRIDEISQGFYRVEGVDRFGHKISRDGIDPNQLLINCRTDFIDKLQLK